MRMSWTFLMVTMIATAQEKASLAVVHKLGGGVGFYTAEGKFLSATALSKHPHEMLLSADGKTLYVSDNGLVWMTDPGEGENTISIVDVATRKKTGAIDLGANRRPHGMDLVPGKDQLVVTIENPDGLLLVDVKQRKVIRRYEVDGKKPHMVAVDKKGEHAYVSNDASDTVAVIHLATGKIVKRMPMGRRPQGGVMTPDGRLFYLTNMDAGEVLVIDTAKQEVIRKMKADGGPARISLTPDGKTLVYNQQKINGAAIAEAATGKVIAALKLPGMPLSLTMSPDGRYAYAGLQDTGKVAVIGVAERKIVRVIETPKGAGPDPVIPLP